MDHVPENLIYSLSGIRGKVGKNLTPEVAKKIAIAFGLWINSKYKDNRVVIGRDTRPSGKELQFKMQEGLLATGCEVFDLGICPTPSIIFEKNTLGTSAGIIISGSHNPPEWNGIKLLSEKTFLSNADLGEISANLGKINLNDFDLSKIKNPKPIKKVNAIPAYKEALLKNVNLEKVKQENHLSVVVDTGAGAGNLITPSILEEMGCEVKMINHQFDENGNFPREIEPIEQNLNDLIVKVWKGKHDVGFAHDCDADRLAIVGDDWKCYREDVGLALIADHYLKQASKNSERIIFVTNLASSMVFEALAQKYGAKVSRVPVGEMYLAKKMDELIIKNEKQNFCDTIMGGEGSCGGIMLPSFNNARDGIFAAAKIIEILVERKEKISNLVKELPQYYSYRDKIDITGKNIPKIIDQLKEELKSEGEEVNQIGLDLRIEHGNDWFILIHPSNTEPVMRILTEARRDALARMYCETTSELVKLVVSKL